jgi:uncharacterized protein
MPPITDQLDLGHLGLKPGGGTRFETAVRVGAFVFGAQRYELADDPVIVLVDVSRTTTGYVIRARTEVELEGPCMRCSDDFALPLAVDQSEIHEPTLDPELASDYVTEGKFFDLTAFVRDAVGLTIPASVSGRLDEADGCRDCGRSREQLLQIGVVTAEAEPEPANEPDPRWAKLRELEL